MNKTKSLNETLAKIQVELKAKKTKYNKFGKYYYRSAEDILEALKPHLTKHNVSVRIKEKIVAENVIESVAILYDGLMRIKASAIVGVDLNQAGQSMPQKWGTASSYAKKYALGNLFLLDDTADDDATNKHLPTLKFNSKTYKDIVKRIQEGTATIKQVEENYSLDKFTKLELNKIIKQLN
jgi:predicted flavoprotein YhiN